MLITVPEIIVILFNGGLPYVQCTKNHLTCENYIVTHTHTTPFNAPFSGTTRVSRYRKVKPIWILLEQETVSGSSISWAVCKFAPRSRQTARPAPHHSVFTGRMSFLLPNQQRQSTEGTITLKLHENYIVNYKIF